MEIFKTIGHIIPEEYTKHISTMLQHAGSKREVKEFIGIVSILSIVFFILALVAYFAFTPIQSEFMSIAKEFSDRYLSFISFVLYLFSIGMVYFFVGTIIYSYYSLKAEIRRNAIETIMPDFLSLVSSNVRGGMPLEQALWQAAKPEFGILSKEVKDAMKESFSGVPIETALVKLASRFNSPLFERSINILKESVRTGGEIAVVLEKIAEESRDVLIVKREMRSVLLIYVIFLVFASSIGVPVLLAVSEKMVGTLQQTFSLSGVSNQGTNDLIGFTISKPPFSEQEFHGFSLITIFITTFITSFIVSVAYTGSKRQAFRFFPFMVIIAYVLYILSLGAVGYILVSMV